MSTSILAMWMPGGLEWAVILVVALLIFGKRLPDVARSVGKSIVEFKRGIRDMKDDVDTRSQMESSRPSELPTGDADRDSTAESSTDSSQKPTTPS